MIVCQWQAQNNSGVFACLDDVGGQTGVSHHLAQDIYMRCDVRLRHAGIERDILHLRDAIDKSAAVGDV